MRPDPTALPVSRSAIFFVTAILLFASLLFAPGSFAQETTTQTPPQYRGVQTHVDGVFVTPVANVPLSMLPETSNATPVILSMHIFDPTTKLNTFMDPETHVARQSVFDRPAA